MQGEASVPLQRGCPRCGAPVPPENLELHLLRCQPAGVVGSVFGGAVGEQWACSGCTFLNAEEQQCCAMCGGMRDDAEAQSPARGAAVLGSVFGTGQAEAALGVLEAAEAEAGQEAAEAEAGQEAAQEAHGAMLAAMRSLDEAAAAEAEAEAEEHPSGAGARRPHEVGRGGQPVSAALREAAALHPRHEQPPHAQPRSPGAAQRRQQARRYCYLLLLPSATPYLLSTTAYLLHTTPYSLLLLPTCYPLLPTCYTLLPTCYAPLPTCTRDLLPTPHHRNPTTATLPHLHHHHPPSPGARGGG